MTTLCMACERPTTECVCGEWRPTQRMRLRSAIPVPQTLYDLCFYPSARGVAIIRIKKSASEPGYYFQLLDDKMDIQVETYHVDLVDVLQQVVMRMKIDGRRNYRVEGL